MTDADKARAIARQAEALAQRLEAVRDPNNPWTQSAQFEHLMFCNAVLELVPEGDLLTERENMMHELHCDENGDPVREEGELSSYDRRAILNPIYTGGGRL